MLTGAHETSVKDAKKGSNKVVNVMPLFRAPCLSQTTSLLTKTRAWGLWSVIIGIGPKNHRQGRHINPRDHPFSLTTQNNKIKAFWRNIQIEISHTCSLL